MKIKSGDNVIMLSGKDRLKRGKVLKVLRSSGRAVVEGLNLLKRHVRARSQSQKGQIVSKERAVSVSSLALICKSCGRQTRIGYKIESDQKIRICKKCQVSI